MFIWTVITVILLHDIKLQTKVTDKFSWKGILWKNYIIAHSNSYSVFLTSVSSIIEDIHLWPSTRVRGEYREASTRVAKSLPVGTLLQVMGLFYSILHFIPLSHGHIYNLLINTSRFFLQIFFHEECTFILNLKKKIYPRLSVIGPFKSNTHRMDPWPRLVQWSGSKHRLKLHFQLPLGTRNPSPHTHCCHGNSHQTPALCRCGDIVFIFLNFYFSF